MKRLLLFTLFYSAAWAGAITLVNDTSNKLVAIIKSADGKELGQAVINPYLTYKWTDYWGGIGYYNQSQTPYRVLWYCNVDLEPFSVCDGVSSGSTITAMFCQGTRACKPAKKKPTQNQPLYPQQQLQEQTEESAGPPEGVVGG